MAEREDPVKPKSRSKRALLSVLIVLVLLAFGAILYISIHYKAESSALSALESDESVTVAQTEYGWLFDGPGTDDALVFYPGGKVDAEAYAPLLHRLAGEGLDVCLVKMPLRFAFFGMNKAETVMARHTYRNWYIGGHSLGGAIAALWAADNADTLSGLILLAAYPTKPLDKDLTCVLLYGSEDKVVNREKIVQGRDLAPDDYTEYVIPGGNHAQFGNYGEQNGDGEASISWEKQQEETVRVIMEHIES